MGPHRCPVLLLAHHHDGFSRAVLGAFAAAHTAGVGELQLAHEHSTDQQVGQREDRPENEGEAPDQLPQDIERVKVAPAGQDRSHQPCVAAPAPGLDVGHVAVTHSPVQVVHVQRHVDAHTAAQAVAFEQENQ